MLDKFTFGKTPAARFLADRLNEINDQKLTHRVSSVINATTQRINEAVYLHKRLGMSTSLLYYVVDKISQDVSATATDMIRGVHSTVYDQVCCNLMANVLRGHIKSIKRRLVHVVNIQNQQKKEMQKAAGPILKKVEDVVFAKLELRPVPVTIERIVDKTNEATLIAKSVKRMKKRGITADFLK